MRVQSQPSEGGLQEEDSSITVCAGSSYPDARARAGLTNRNLSLMIAAVIGVSVLGGGWYLIQIQNNRMDFSIPRASALLNYLG